MKRIGLLLIALLLSAACNYNHVKEKGDDEGADGRSLTDLSEEEIAAADFALVGPILESRCNSCHADMRKDNYMEVSKKYISILQRVKSVGTPRQMPPGTPLNSIQLKAIENWVNLGAPEKIEGPLQKPDPTLDIGPLTFEKVRDAVFKAKCLDCHSAPPAEAGPDAKPDGNLDLTSYDQVREKASKIFEALFVTNSMPMKPYPSLTPKERSLLLRWFEEEMPR